MNFATASIASNLAEHHVPERRPVDGLLTKDVLEGPVHVDRVDDRVTVSGDVK